MIAIRNMGMPKSCEECPILKVEEFEWEDDGYWEWDEQKICPLIDDHINNEKDTRCPLVPCIGIIRGYKEHKPKFDFDEEVEECEEKKI